MPPDDSLSVRRLTEDDLPLMHDVLTLFGAVFEEPATYDAARPDNAYLTRLLAKPHFIAVAALVDDDVVGGIAAYELEKFEQARSEIYIYDLAVARDHRRRGVATAMIETVRRIARDRGAWTVFVQADQGDEPAIALYSTFGEREVVLHFDILVDTSDQTDGGQHGKQ